MNTICIPLRSTLSQGNLESMLCILLQGKYFTLSNVQLFRTIEKFKSTKDYKTLSQVPMKYKVIHRGLQRGEIRGFAGDFNGFFATPRVELHLYFMATHERIFFSLMFLLFFVIFVPKNAVLIFLKINFSMCAKNDTTTD
jgi:hypothetical protein